MAIINETCVLINYKDRPTEISMLLESLKYQTYQLFDIYILDDCSGTPLTNYHFFNCMVTRLKLEGHKILIRTTGFPHGVSRARQNIVDWAMEKDYKYFLRVDDDVILNKDYIQKLADLLQDYDIASGVTIPMVSPTFVRKPSLKVINRVILDKDGNHLFNGDDCGMQYTDSVILPAHHFRSCALIKRKVHEKVKYYPTKLSMHGFREEQIFSYKAQMEGFKIGVDTKAETWHQMTPSGGERGTTNFTKFNEEKFCEFTKENKDKLCKLFTGTMTKQELMKETNCQVK